MRFAQEMKVIGKGVEEIITRAEMINKLEKAEKTGKPLRIKYGIDPTGFDIHIGHLVPIRKMREFQDLGHTGVIIIGDYTAQIGDPTGRDESRPPLTAEEVKANSVKYMEQLVTVLDPTKTEVRLQSEWFSKMHLTDVLNLMGKFTLAQFMAHDTFRNRWEQGLPLGMHEILYPILQAYDSVAIEADVELGATEQKFNILCGRDMQRYFGVEQQVAILSPILIGTDGSQKMSKSFNNYIAVLDPPNEKYGKVMSIPDSIIINYFNYATTLDPDEIIHIKQELDGGINPMIVKKRLAREIVLLYHGQDAALAAQDAFEKVFSKKEMPDEVLEWQTTADTYKIIDLLTDTTLCESKSEAKRMIIQKAVSLDNVKIGDIDAVITVKDGSLLRVGKRKFIRMRTG